MGSEESARARVGGHLRRKEGVEVDGEGHLELHVRVAPPLSHRLEVGPERAAAPTALATEKVGQHGRML